MGKMSEFNIEQRCKSRNKRGKSAEVLCLTSPVLTWNSSKWSGKVQKERVSLWDG